MLKYYAAMNSSLTECYCGFFSKHQIPECRVIYALIPDFEQHGIAEYDTEKDLRRALQNLKNEREKRMVQDILDFRNGRGHLARAVSIIKARGF